MLNRKLIANLHATSHIQKRCSAFKADLRIAMKIYGISGLGADKRVFNFLSLDYEIVPIEWIKPKPRESIVEYSKRIIEKYEIGKEEEFGLLDVSFGGLIAVEISKLTKPKFTILISSLETADELSKVITLARKTKIVEKLPKELLIPPRIIAHYLFGTKNRELLNSILDDTDLSFTKWAVKELVNWGNQTRILNLIKISGTNDKLLSPKGDNTILIENGEHFMIVDRAKEISKIINEEIKTHYNITYT